MYALLLAEVQPRVPNVAKYTYESHIERPFLVFPTHRAPDPIRPPEASPHKPARMPIPIMYDPMMGMNRVEKWHLYGAHTVMESGASAPRGKMVGFLNRIPIRRLNPRAYGSQIEEIGGEYE